ncbi:hypothetical protein [Ferrimonas balearica]|uniref:hypothetical protein n=1 Tax=Ferrimonas balearica TaxID=44012 RepID=UPI001C99F4C8|nr:hypothetical protein [Ferrimonas balearica]MBY5991175.1 hypothetical protein [Ferrimonas balearica]
MMKTLNLTLSALALLTLAGCSSDDHSGDSGLEPVHPIMPAPALPVEPERDLPMEVQPERPIEDIEGEQIAPDLAMLGEALMIPSEDGQTFVLRFIEGQHVKEERFDSAELPTNLNQAELLAEARYLTQDMEALNWNRQFRAQWGEVAEYTVNSRFSGTWLRAAPEYELVLSGETVSQGQSVTFEHLGEQDYLVSGNLKGLDGAGDIPSQSCQFQGQLHRQANEAGYIGELVATSCTNQAEANTLTGYITARSQEDGVAIQVHGVLERDGQAPVYYGADLLSR